MSDLTKRQLVQLEQHVGRLPVPASARKAELLRLYADPALDVKPELLGKREEAIAEYVTLLDEQPGHAAAHAALERLGGKLP